MKRTESLVSLACVDVATSKNNRSMKFLRVPKSYFTMCHTIFLKRLDNEYISLKVFAKCEH